MINILGFGDLIIFYENSEEDEIDFEIDMNFLVIGLKN